MLVHSLSSHLACYETGIILEGTYVRAIAGKAPTATLHAITLSLFRKADELVRSRMVPEKPADEQAFLLTDALAAAKFGISRCEIRPGDTVAVVGLRSWTVMAAIDSEGN
ncbi:MAG: hypothetical protein KDB20_11785 [Microthrixaceae bacterium]|nr:hypothetical protein [Microthrixaceae bacterium]